MRLSIAILLLLCSALRAMALDWKGRDAEGHALQIPANGQLCVVVFIQPGQSYSQGEIADVRKTTDTPGLQDVRVIGVVSGPNAARRAAALDTRGWPVAVDEEYGCSGRFEVFAWPTTIVFDKEGQIAGRIPGAPINFTARLAAYLELAAGKITRDQLNERLDDFHVIEDSADQKSMRHLLLVDQLLFAGRRADARLQLQQAQELSPVAEPVRLRLARAQLLLGKTKQAADLLAAVEGKNARHGELSFLRGWAALDLGDFAKAEDLLLQARKAGAPAVDVEYRLGLLYERQQKYREAADAFGRAYEAARTERATGDR